MMDGTPARLLIEELDEESGRSRTVEIDYGCTEVKVGRDRTSEVVLESPSASRRHCTLSFQDGDWFVTDQDSTLGTFHNDAKLEPEAPQKLAHGDLVKCATHLLRIHLVPLTDPTLRPDPNALARLLDEVEEDATPPRVWIFASAGVPPVSHALPREGTVLTLGRSADCDIQLDDPFRVVSAVHARVERTWAGAFLFDSSTNGIYVNGRRVEGQVQIKDGDRITITVESQEADRPLLVFTESGNDTEPRWEGSASAVATGVGVPARSGPVPPRDDALSPGQAVDPVPRSPQSGSSAPGGSGLASGSALAAGDSDRVGTGGGSSSGAKASQRGGTAPRGEGGRGELDARLGPAAIDPLATPSSGRPPINWLLITVIVVSVLALATVLVWGVILLRG